jgi:hypothetical protein
MKLHQLFKSTVAALACVGTLIPGNLLEASEAPRQVEARKIANMVRDLALTNEGLLQGQVTDAKNAASEGVAVSLRQDRKEVIRTKTNERGRFEVRDLKPGIYYVVAGTGHGLYRVWANNTAPPKALKSARIISDNTRVRGQNDEPDGRILYDEYGVAYGQVRIVDNGGLVPVSPAGAFAGPSVGFLDSLGLYDVLVLAGVGTAIGLGIAALDDDEDNTNN